MTDHPADPEAGAPGATPSDAAPDAPRKSGTVESEVRARAAAVGARGAAEFRSTLARLHLTPLTMGIALGTLVVLLVGVAWSDHLVRYLRETPVVWTLYAAAFLLAYGQYVGYAISLSGASTTPLPHLRTLQLEVAESFTQMATPEAVGSLALSMRYLTGRGLATAEAATAVGLSAFVTTASGAVVVPVAAIFAAHAIDVAQLKKDVPSSTWLIVLLVLAVAVVATVLVKAPKARQKVRSWVDQARSYADTIVHHPARALVIAGGEAVTVVSQTACMLAILAALHLHSNVAAVVIITQLAGAASNIVPVPGGLGAPEAILVAGLTALGLHASDVAVAALTYRMATYWLPPLPGLVLLFDLFRRRLV